MTQATALSRLRHPDILHMVEPLEESRSELTFVTETVTATLGNLIAAAKSGKGRSDDAGEVDLDEVEIQKGTLQIAKGLGFLHQQAKSVHLNLNPDAILINAKVGNPHGLVLTRQGDWKLSGLQYTTPLQGADGNPTRAQYPEVDGRLPPQIQWKLDYLGELFRSASSAHNNSPRVRHRPAAEHCQRPVLARLCAVRRAYRQGAVREPRLVAEPAGECRRRADEARVRARATMGAEQQRAQGWVVECG